MSEESNIHVLDTEGLDACTGLDKAYAEVCKELSRIAYEKRVSRFAMQGLLHQIATRLGTEGWEALE